MTIAKIKIKLMNIFNFSISYKKLHTYTGVFFAIVLEDNLELFSFNSMVSDIGTWRSCGVPSSYIIIISGDRFFFCKFNPVLIRAIVKQIHYINFDTGKKIIGTCFKYLDINNWVKKIVRHVINNNSR